MSTGRNVQQTFPMGDKRRIQLPRFRGPEGLGSWRVVCPRQRVRPTDPNDLQSGSDENGYWPIQAVFVGCESYQPGGYGSWPVYENDCLSRASIILDSVWTVDGEDLTIPLTMAWQIKSAAAGVPTVLKSGTISFAKGDFNGTTLGKTGLIAYVSAPLGNEFQLWAKTIPDNSGILRPLDVSLQFAVDRLGDRVGSFLGRIANGGELPTLNP